MKFDEFDLPDDIKPDSTEAYMYNKHYLQQYFFYYNWYREWCLSCYDDTNHNNVEANCDGDQVNHQSMGYGDWEV